jgi:sugar phosphate isomerase/epimerase
VSHDRTDDHDRKLSRRDFLALLGVTPAFLATNRPNAQPPNRPTAQSPDRPVPLGIQLYTLRDLLAKDVEGTLAAIAAIGYQEVELAGLYGRTAADFRAILDRVGLKTPAGHVGIPAITDTLDQTIADAKTLGQQFVIVPWLPEESRTADGYRKIAETFNAAGEKLRAAGLTLGYHNHWFEFDALGSGPAACGYDILLARTDPKFVVMELDLYWIRKGGRDAATYFRDHRGRFRLVHVKDMSAGGTMVDVGQGVIRWADLLAGARKAGVSHFLIEHDEAKDPLAFARTSYDYLKSIRF